MDTLEKDELAGTIKELEIRRDEFIEQKRNLLEVDNEPTAQQLIQKLTEVIDTIDEGLKKLYQKR